MADNATIYCRQCGQPNASTHRHCTRCGRSLDSQTIYVAQGASGVEAVIPITNPSSLWAYYLGVFSLIPCLGIPLGIAALVCGIKGLAMSKTLPRNAGRLHSWAGMVLGAFFAILYLVLTVFAVAGISSTLKPQ